MPKLTHLQFLVLEILLTGPTEKAGKDVRAHLAANKVRKTGPAFYQLMSRMEDAGLVEGWYMQEIIDGQIIKQRWYRAKGKGAMAYNDTREFYISRAPAKGGLAGA
ncbi:MAG: hypothetical protein ACKVW3_05630 [Phycisphaerales bacterium]